MAVWGILGVCMLLDCREPALLLWVIILNLAVFFPKDCVLFLRHFLIAFLRMLRCSLCPVQSSATFFNSHVPPCSGRCGAFLRAEFLPPCAGARGLCGSVRCPPFAGRCCADLRGRRSLNGWWSLRRLWTKVCNRICSVPSSSDSSDLVTHCCNSGSCAFVVSRTVSPVPSASPVLVVLGWALGWVLHGVGWKVGFPIVFVFQLGRWVEVLHLAAPIRGRTRLMHVVPRERCVPKVGFRSGRRFASCLRAGVNFRQPGGVRWQVAGSLPGRQPSHRYQAVEGRCGHTFPPPGGSWYPIRVTWIRIGHQAINGLDEGVWNRTVGGLGAEG